VIRLAGRDSESGLDEREPVLREDEAPTAIGGGPGRRGAGRAGRERVVHARVGQVSHRLAGLVVDRHVDDLDQVARPLVAGRAGPAEVNDGERDLGKPLDQLLGPGGDATGDIRVAAFDDQSNVGHHLPFIGVS